MKVTVKHNLIIFHRPEDWYELSSRLRIEHGASTMYISSKCRRELGFTVRYHKGLVEHEKDTWSVMKSEGFHNRYHYEEQVHLDFYNEAQMSWFVLKYLNN